ncbi:MAG: hypothetical protein QNJ84_05260 [Alphaproteobacteria bacterium]|nr:hypothetical protein [Alphaproteobacteria bacterium]
MIRIAFLFVAVVLAAPHASAQNRIASVEREATALALYQNGPAIVREVRPVTLAPGETLIALHGLPSGAPLDGMSVQASDPSVALSITANREGLSRAALLRRSIGREIEWAHEGAVRRAVVISVTGGVVLEIDGKIEIDPPGRPVFPASVLEQADAPPILLRARSQSGGPVSLTLLYQAPGLTWRADHIGRYDATAQRLGLDVGAIVMNETDSAFSNASVTLVAGFARRQSVPDPGPAPMAMRMSVEAADSLAEPPPPERAGDLWRFTLQGALDLPAWSERREALAATREIAVRQVYRLTLRDRRRGPTPEALRPTSLLSFRNTGEAGLGLPLPGGALRVYQEGGAPLLLGEDRLPDIAEGQEVEVLLGEAFDITVERRQTAFRQTDQRGGYEAGYEITLKNAKPVGATVQVEALFPGEWRILEESAPHTSRDANRAEWSMAIPAAGETVLTYRVSVRP